MIYFLNRIIVLEWSFTAGDKDLSTAALRKEWLKERDELRLLYNVANNLI
jgi:hypothetical protein